MNEIGADCCCAKSIKAFSREFGIEMFYDIFSDGRNFIVKKEPFPDKELAKALGVLKAYKRAVAKCGHIEIFSSLSEAEEAICQDICEAAV